MRALCLLLLMLPLSSACSADRPSFPKGEPPLLTYIILDGLSQEIFFRELDAGRLPHIQELAQRGTMVRDVVSAFPSMTGYGFYPLQTGCGAQRSGVLGLRFWDRARADGPFRNYVGRTSRLMNGDVGDEIPTVFEEVAPAYTESFNIYFNKGVAESHIGGLDFGLAKYGASFWLTRLAIAIDDSLVPTWMAAESDLVDRAIANLARVPKVTWLHFASPDGSVHVGGMTPAYAEILRGLDGEIGRYLAAVKAAGQQRSIVLGSDHGVMVHDRNVDLRASLAESIGVRVYRGPATELLTSALDHSPADFDDYDGLVAINGNGLNYLYVRTPGEAGLAGFAQPKSSAELRAMDYGDRTVDWIGALRETMGVELVFARGPGQSIEVHDRTGYAVLAQVGSDASVRRYRYAPVTSDPLGYRHDARASKLMHTSPTDAPTAKEWLDATVDTQFPFAPVRVVELFKEKNVGDIVVTSAPGYDLAADYELIVGNYRGGHGGLRRDQTLVPFIFSGPEIAAGRSLSPTTVEDVGATARALLGLSVRENCVGRPLNVWSP